MDDRHAVEIIAQIEMGEELDICLSHLPESDKDLIALRYGADWSIERIASHLEIKEEAVRKRISRARKKLAFMIERSRKGG